MSEHIVFTTFWVFVNEQKMRTKLSFVIQNEPTFLKTYKELTKFFESLN